MAADNQTTIAGNLVDTPELRFTNTGTPVTNLRVAVTQRIQQDGEWRDGETSFFKVNVWRGQAEHLADSLSKGDRVMVTGRLRQRSWETPEGEKRSVAEIEADEVGASLKFATAKVERATERSHSDRTQGRERQAERGGDFNDQPPFEEASWLSAPRGFSPGRRLTERFASSTRTIGVALTRIVPATILGAWPNGFASCIRRGTTSRPP
jgi:single-strand DNA-binding protein